VIFSGLSYEGRRSSNQDSYYCGNINGFTLLAVADGMGGHNGGEIASRIAIDTLVNTVDDFKADKPQELLKEILLKGFSIADQAIKKTAEQNANLSGMGTTLTALLFFKDAYVCASLGDSRCYVQKNNHIECLTKDHTYIQQYIEEFGGSVPEEIRENGHVLVKALDGDGDVPDLFPADEPYYIASDNSVFLIVSDGLILDKELEFENILRSIINYSQNEQQLCEQLISYAYHFGSKDNCTVVSGSIKKSFRRKTRKKLFDGYPPHKYPAQDHIEEILHEFQSEHRISSTYLTILLAVLLGFLMVGIIYFSTIKDSNISTNSSPNIYNFLDEQINKKIIWERGFTNINTSNPFFDGTTISWYQPDGTDVNSYKITILQNNLEIYTQQTTQTSFTLSNDHGYNRGQIIITLEALIDGNFTQPSSRGMLIVNYQK